MNRNGKWIGLQSAVIAALVAAAPLGAQQVVDLPEADRRINPNFEEVFRVGALDGADWETFGDIGGTAFDAAGNLYIFDTQSSRVVVVDPAGKYLRTVGKPGEGPGELRMPMPSGMSVMRDGTVVIADMGHRAYSMFKPDGSFDRLVSMAGGGGMIRAGQLSPDPRGGSFISGGGGMSISMSSGPGGGRPEMPTTRPIERLMLTGTEAVSEPLADAWMAPRGTGDGETLRTGGATLRVAMPQPPVFEPGLFVGALPDGGVVYADSSTYALKVLAADGSPVRTLRRPIGPAPVTEAIKEAELKRQLDEINDESRPTGMRIMVAGGGGSSQARPVADDQIREMMRGRLASLTFYHELSVITALRTSWSGKIWVQRRGAAPTEAGPIDVLTADGQYAGTFTTGATSIPGAFGPNGLAAYVETDEFDVPTVIVRRIPAVLN